jgi:CubicO group peptidase (beta-lactamase class C family)
MRIPLYLVCAAGVAAGCATARPPWTAMEAAIDRGEFPQTTSVMVVQDGATVYEHYWQANVDTQHDTRSATKSITALAVGIALGQGKLPSVDAPAFGYLADLAPFANDAPAKQSLTVADLLTMSSALDCNDDVDDSPGNEENMYPKQQWARWAVDLPTRAYARDATGRGPFAYCTAGVFLLGQIVARAVGAKIDDWLDDVLFHPLGITQGEWSKSPSGEIMTGGGLRLRTRDLVVLARMVMAGGNWQGRQIVPAEFIARATTVQRRASNEAEYGYLFWNRQYRSTCGTTSGWFMSGNGGNAIVILRELHAVVAVTRVHYNSRGMHDETRKLIETFVLPNLPCPGPRA